VASYNRVVLIGNLTRDVEVRYTQGGSAVTDLGLAVNERVKKGNEWIDEPCFVDCTAFGRNAEVAGEYLGKGSPVLIEGRLKLEQWESGGQKRSKLKVVCDRLQLLGSRGERGQSRQPSPGPAASRHVASSVTHEEDIPF
jgi:single-strand DNA-binding protein